MARDSQPTHTRLTLHLNKEIWRANFYRFCQLLEQENPNAPLLGTTSYPKNDPVRFRPWPGMGFPISTLKTVETDENNPHLPPTVRTKSVFYKKIKTLNLDFSPRAAVNADGEQTPLATMVWVYQLKDRKSVDAADYQTVLRTADAVLKDDLLASQSLLVMPKGSATLKMAMEEGAQFVAVVALFNRPDMKDNRWRLVLSRDDLDPDNPRTIELADGWLTLLPVKE